MAPALPRVALLIETSKSYGRGLLRGISQYMKEQGVWALSFEPRDVFTSAPGWLRTWRGDGILARLSTPAIARAVLRVGVPVVNLSSALPGLRVPRLETDTDALARTAFEHLFERGFRAFAFVGDDLGYPAWSKRIERSFAGVVAASGLPCAVFPARRRPGASPGRLARSWEREQRDLARWLSRLPRPVGVYVVNDARGQRVLDACRRVGASVPDDIAVLANENDELVCSLSTPPLSSVVQNAEKIGYEAARLLEALMAGGRQSPRAEAVRAFAPLGVATRQSTEVEAHADPVVGRAVRFIRENAARGLHVADVLAAVGVSRTNLDRRFLQALGRTPHDEIVRVQLQRAMELLAQTPMKLLAVAEKAGFRHAEYMGVVFRKKLGITPGEYRKRAASSGEAFVPGTTDTAPP